MAVVALGSRPEAGTLAPGLGEQPGHLVLDTVFYLLLVAGVLGLLVAGWALWPDPELDTPPLPRRRRPLGLAATMAFLVVGLVWWRSRWGELPGFEAPPPVGVAPSPAHAPGPGGQPPAPTGDWIALALVAVLLVGGAALLGWRLRPAAGRPVPSRPRSSGLEQALDDAVEDVLVEADPRRAVIAAWAHLERVLAAHGLPRRQPEAPFEYAARAFAELGVTKPTLEALARLFEWARFSVNEVSPEMREQAVRALLAVRDEVRLAA